MKIFNSFADFANDLSSTDLKITESLNEIVDTTLQNIKDRHGVYPSDITWEQLKPETIRQKRRGNTPLLETGELRDSYKKRISASEGEVSSDNPKAGWMEFGVVSRKGNIPARPVAEPESIKAKDYAKEIAEINLRNSLQSKYI